MNQPCLFPTRRNVCPCSSATHAVPTSSYDMGDVNEPAAETIEQRSTDFQKYQWLVALDPSVSSPIRLVLVFGEDLGKLIAFVRVLQHAVCSEKRLERFTADHEMCPPNIG
ncbi:hypothetical protein FALCPG4_003576 [Fusarium falciforme]